MATTARLVPSGSENESLLRSRRACAVATGTAESTSQENDSMARRRHQTGRVIIRGKNPPVFVGQWRENVIQEGRSSFTKRIRVSKLGTRRFLRTVRADLREVSPLGVRQARADRSPWQNRAKKTFRDLRASPQSLPLAETVEHHDSIPA
jgi:hypothetical protein